MPPLPPLTALRAFEAAARLLSFRDAAAELNVTPAAISQQVRALEAAVGQPLFRRTTRAVALTDAGREAAPLLSEGFGLIAAAASAMRAPRRSRLLTVSVAPSFGAKWLLPRLDRFAARHPEIDLRLDASDTLADFATDDVDVAIRYGRGGYPGLTSLRLMSEVAFPVCSPALLRRGPPLRTPRDLLGHTLLHVHWKLESEAAPNWPMWLRAAGVDPEGAERGPRFSVDSMALQAAIEGHGVALASGAIAAADLREGRLVNPFTEEMRQATRFRHHLVHPPGRGDEARIAAFRDWLLVEIARDGAVSGPESG